MSLLEVATLRRTVEDMEARLRALEEGMGGARESLTNIGATHSEALILGALLRKKFCTREALFLVLYGNKDDAPGDKIIDVFICKLRKKFGLQIKCSRCADFSINTGGYSLTDEDRLILKKRIAG